MAIRRILSYPDAINILKEKSGSVNISEAGLENIIRDLKDTLSDVDLGVGLAAPQIGFLKRIFVLKKNYILNDLEQESGLRRSEDKILVFINPKIISGKGEVVEEEGCLSIPGSKRRIKRSKAIKLRALDEKGRQIYEKFKGLAARAIQQEMDHLDGILITDYPE